MRIDEVRSPIGTSIWIDPDQSRIGISGGMKHYADPVFSTSDARFKAGGRAIEAGNREKQQTSAADATRIIEHLADNSTGQLAIRRLPFTRLEAEQILAVAPIGSNLKALDFRANRSIATSGELSKFRYVHFATHGYLDRARADLSAIVPSLFDEQGKPQDGFLRVLDIYNLNLPAELVDQRVR